MTKRSSTGCPRQRHAWEGRPMLDLAQVTDLHLVEPDHANRTGSEWQRLHYLSVGRRVDAAGAA